MKRIINLFRDFGYGVKNLFRFLPVVWKVRDWDYDFALDLFKFQLSNMAGYMESDHAFKERSKDTASRIRTAVSLIEKTYGNGYWEETFDKIEEKYGKGILDVEFEELDNSLYGIKMNLSEEVEKDFRTFVKESNEKDKKARELLWRFIGHNIENWWD